MNARVRLVFTHRCMKHIISAILHLHISQKTTTLYLYYIYNMYIQVIVDNIYFVCMNIEIMEILKMRGWISNLCPLKYSLIGIYVYIYI